MATKTPDIDHNRPVSPGEILQEEFMKALGLNQNRLARDIGVNPAWVTSSMVARRSPLLSRPLGKYFGTTPEVWLNLQSGYDLGKEREELAKDRGTRAGVGA